MHFTTSLQKEPTGRTIHGRPEYRLTEPLEFAASGFGLVACVPRGFETDLASAPWGFRWLLAKWPRPAVLHDWLCRRHKCSRFLADAIFRDAMASQGVPLWRRVLAFYVVRCAAIVTGKK